ncbi:hypothetical protein PG988_012447 [Apiospora saccharicola]
MGSVANLQPWQEKVDWARAKRDASLAKVEPKLTGIPDAADSLPLSSQDLPKTVLTDREIEITEQYGIVQLLGLLRERKITVEEVTRAFLRRAALAQVATNCLTELLWDQAIARAKHLDSLPEPRGALFGLPISTKEHHGMVSAASANVTTSASFVAWVGKPHEGPNLLYDTFWNEGCVFFARTTQPQTIMHLETESNVYGRTVNPYNRELSSGGVVGGVGGDIGGSIRCPAAHVGIYGFKPSIKRIGTAGFRNVGAGKETIQGCPGPMTVDRDGLELFMKVALAAKPWRIEPSLTVKEWTPHKFTKPLKIAVQWWDGVVKPHPPMIRALREVADACRKAGMEVVDWDCTGLDHQKGWDILSALYWPDGGKEFIIHEQPTVKEMTQHELWKASLCVERDAYRTRYAQAWSQTANDADGSGESRYWGYTANWNLLDYPAAVFPVTKVDPALDLKDLSYVPKNDQDKFVYDMYTSPERFRDAPVSLQVVGRRQEEEKVLAALGEIERAMGRA